MTNARVVKKISSKSCTNGTLKVTLNIYLMSDDTYWIADNNSFVLETKIKSLADAKTKLDKWCKLNSTSHCTFEDF